MDNYCVLKIGTQTRAWQYDLPAFLSFLFDKDSFYQKPQGKKKSARKIPVYISTCGKALERLNHFGFDWPIMEKVYNSYYDDLYENFVFELEYEVGTRFSDWDFDTQEDYIEGYLARLLKLSRMDQLRDFRAFYLPMIMADLGEKTSLIKSMDGRLYELKKSTHKSLKYALEGFSFDRYFGLPPWILLIAGLFSYKFSRNLDEVISAMDIRFLLESYEPETNVELNLAALINYEREIEGLHDRLTRRLVNKVNLYNSILGSAIEKNAAVRNIHFKMHVKSTLETLSDRQASNDLKGKRLEELMGYIFSTINGLYVSETRVSLGDEEIDLVIQNNINRPFWLSFQSPAIFVECKNWSRKVGAPEFRDFEGKLKNHGTLAKLGFFISYKGFSSEVRTALQRSSREAARIILITGDDLKELSKPGLEVLEWLENLMMKLQ